MATFYGINVHHGPLKATKEWNQGRVGGQVLHSEVQEQGVSTPMPSLGPNPKATGLLNCILNQHQHLSFPGRASPPASQLAW